MMITLRLLRAARMAPSLMRLARSAPENPGVCLASTSSSTDGSSGLLRAWTSRMARRPRMSARSSITWRSKRPGRSSAGSSTSGRLVAAITMTWVAVSNPSISTRSWLSVCSRSSWPPPKPAPRWRPTASISSTKTMQGEFFLAWSKRSRTRLAPTPTNISTNSDPLMLKNGTPASPATALLSSVLPVPGGPTRRTPLGMRAPTAVNLSGYLRNSTISDSSCLASSTPATSAKVMAGLSPVSSRARLRPKDIAWLLPLCVWRKIQSRKSAINPNRTRFGKRMLKRKLLPLLDSLRKLL